MASYFAEKGLPDPEQKQTTNNNNSNSNNGNNPDVSSFFTSSSSSSNNIDENQSLEANLEQFFSLANLLGTLRDQGAGDNTHQEFLDNLISQLTEEANASAKGPPPASKSFINKLPIVPKSDINSDETCIICADKFHGGGDKLVTSLPCKHKFDKECIIPWLELHNTCPNYRHEVDSDDPIWRQKQKDLKNQQIRQEDDEEDVDPIDFMYL